MIINLAKLKTNQSGIIKEIVAGEAAVTRIVNMGIRPGKKIRKISAHFWRGPQTIEIDNLKIALGFGMAEKILIEVED